MPTMGYRCYFFCHGFLGMNAIMLTICLPVGNDTSMCRIGTKLRTDNHCYVMVGKLHELENDTSMCSML